MGNPTFDDLFSDLTLGGVSYWEVAYSSPSTLVPNAGLTGFTPSSTYFRLRQLIHYVRPGAVRIGAAASDPSFHVLAFLTERQGDDGHREHFGFSANGQFERAAARQLWPVESGSGCEFISRTWDSHSGGRRHVERDERGRRFSGYDAVSIFRHRNQPPTIVAWSASPGYVVLPTNTATLSVTANDAELDALTYRWSVTNQPAGANASVG